jgi:hypothetical protein
MSILIISIFDMAKGSGGRAGGSRGSRGSREKEEIKIKINPALQATVHQYIL